MIVTITTVDGKVIRYIRQEHKPVLGRKPGQFPKVPKDVRAAIEEREYRRRARALWGYDVCEEIEGREAGR